MDKYQSITAASSSVLTTNKVIKNTYMLLSMTLLFSALMAGVSMAIAVPYGVSLACSLGALGLIWLVLPRTAESGAGIGVVFGITGLLGFGLGPILSYYLAIPGGSNIVATALGGTGVIFLALSGYVLTTRKDFSFMGGFLMVGLMVVFGAVILNLFLGIPALSMALSAGIILLMSGLILFKTSQIIHGGETNYVMATVDLYLALYNMFTSLLHLLGAMSGDD